MDNQRLQYLLNAYINKAISPSERKELSDWYRKTSAQDAEYPDSEYEVGERMLLRLFKEKSTTKKVVIKPFIRAWGSIAAAILLIFGISLIWYWKYDRIESDRGEQRIVQLDSIRPGTNQATLILEDGSSVALKDREGGIRIDEELQYADGTPVMDNKITPSEKVVLQTPKGGQYKLVLSDGTKVWLNAATTLKYPLHFDENDRVVELNGEAYFEVQKHAESGKYRPFKVLVNGEEVTVLGTNFNIESYAGSPIRRTTLLEGSIRFQDANAKSFMLKPGQQIKSIGSKSSIQHVEVEEFVAWKEGLISFNEDNLRSIMERISRWYNVDVEFQGANPNLHFGGTISKYTDLKEVLARLELTGMVKFEIKERRILVKP